MTLNAGQYTFRGLTPMQRRAELLWHIEAMAHEGCITDEDAVRLYDVGVYLMSAYDWESFKGESDG